MSTITWKLETDEYDDRRHTARVNGEIIARAWRRENGQKGYYGAFAYALRFGSYKKVQLDDSLASCKRAVESAWAAQQEEN